MNRASLCLTALLMAGTAAMPASAGGPFELEIYSYHNVPVVDWVNNARGETCTHTLHFWGIVTKAATPGYPYTMQYRFVTQAGSGPTQEHAFGIVDSVVSLGEKPMNVSLAPNSSRTFWMQLEMLKPYHLLSNKKVVTYQCKVMPPGQKVPTTKWPTN
jgi:hypothetical protein